jgi:hydrogenase expression/formation protein HypC
MCVAVPGKVLEIKDNVARVDFFGNVVQVNVSLVDASPGDYVLTHAGVAIEKLDPERAKELVELFEELGEAGDERD